MEKTTIDAEQDNPATENMNNFHLRMPGGLSRLDSIDPKSIPSVGIRYIMDTYGGFLDLPEESWPQDKVRSIRLLKRELEISEMVDQVLERMPDIAKLWEDKREYAQVGGMTNDLREKILRPVYISLREKFTQEELNA